MGITMASNNERFKTLLKNKPVRESILMSKDGRGVPVFVDLRNGSTEDRVMYVNCAVDDEGTGWYLSREAKGLKVLILPESQIYLIEKYGGLDKLMVDVLRVKRVSRKGTALLAEVLGIRKAAQ